MFKSKITTDQKDRFVCDLCYPTLLEIGELVEDYSLTVLETQ